MVAYSDDFNRANGAVGWTYDDVGEFGNGLSVQDNGCVSDGSSAVGYANYGLTDGVACYAEADYSNHDDSDRMYLKLNGSDTALGRHDGYEFRKYDFHTDQYILRNGTQVAAVGGSSTSVTETYRIEHDGSGGIETFRNGVSQQTYTDASPLTGTVVGLGVKESTYPPATWSVDNWSAGDIVSTTVPAAVTDLAGTAGDQQVELMWTAPDDGGDPITDYVVQYREV